eukprot:CAMPEP_0198133414 /NCGR_PEP_ID=MMETSP1442-20131203/59552_1 /TAXON_ID= /ORGANISM="Craspedostauros australis, Strain CCMP3328" /LENGTH=140 /DNA_ID=CAMNT_0043794531 /DNA_START=849 /DNA_END=1271 /DNA_ORIENTATION=-
MVTANAAGTRRIRGASSAARPSEATEVVHRSLQDQPAQKTSLASQEGFGGAGASAGIAKGAPDGGFLRDSFGGGLILLPFCPYPGYQHRIPQIDALGLTPCEVNSDCEADDCCLYPDCHCAPRAELQEFTAAPYGQCTLE